jgi:hypothetical protein
LISVGLPRRERFGTQSEHEGCEFHPLRKRPLHEANKKAAKTAADSFLN